MGAVLVPSTTRHPPSWQTLLFCAGSGRRRCAAGREVQTQAVYGAPPTLAALEDPDLVVARDDGLRGRISGCHRHGPDRRAPCPRRRCFLSRRRLASWRVMGSHLWASREPGVTCLAAWQRTAGRLSVIERRCTRATASASWLPHERPR